MEENYVLDFKIISKDMEIYEEGRQLNWHNDPNDKKIKKNECCSIYDHKYCKYRYLIIFDARLPSYLFRIRIREDQNDNLKRKKNYFFFFF